MLQHYKAITINEKEHENWRPYKLDFKFQLLFIG